MERDEILREILSDPLIKESYKVKESDLEGISTTPPYTSKVQEVMAVIINENDNHLSTRMIYTKVKNVHGL